MSRIASDGGAARLTRRAALGGAAALAVLGPARVMAGVRDFSLRAGPAQARIAPPPHPRTTVWAYDGTVPGPTIRARQGERLRIRVENALAEPTTVHWHGLRVPNAMDGVPYAGGVAIAPGEAFLYEFDLQDAGTFWYHPHVRSHEQVDRGLSGALIVEEAAPPAVDRELVWLLDDWRLTPQAAVANDFGHPHDLTHAGRLGNTVTINGAIPSEVALRPGERVRLRLINAANARFFALHFGDLAPRIVALDGHPVASHAPEDGLVRLGPAQRVDLLLDVVGPEGARIEVRDRFYARDAYRLVDLALGAPLRAAPPDGAVALAPNPLPEPDLSAAVRHDVLFTGGAMGAMAAARMGVAPPEGGMMGMRPDGAAWRINGRAAMAHDHAPLFSLGLGESCVIAMANATAWPHPIHLHGHAFRVLSRDGAPTAHREWRDTVTIAPQERVEIAFVADNPGDWMFHCHVLEHQAAGMMGLIRVG
jgi:FtsP/CotA-like multicopper oxidase with cupredoxin domain